MKKALLLSLVMVLLVLPVIGCTEPEIVQAKDPDIAVLKTDLATLKADIAAVKAAQAAIQTQLTTLAGKSAPDLSAYAKTTDVSSAINGFNSKIKTLETKIEELNGGSDTPTNGGATNGQVSLSVIARYDEPVYPNEAPQTFRLEIINKTSTAQYVKVDCDFSTTDGNNQDVTSVELKDDDGSLITISPTLPATTNNFYGRTKAIRIQRGASYEMILSVKIVTSSGSRSWDGDFSAKWKDTSW